jgi:hypothetical protein
MFSSAGLVPDIAAGGKSFDFCLTIPSQQGPIAAAQSMPTPHEPTFV